MASNGGTLHGVPQPIHQPSPGGFTCSQCGLLFDSGASLQVHMHYHHENSAAGNTQQPRWQSPSSTNSGGNNSPPIVNDPSSNGQETNNNTNHHIKCESPPAMTGNNSTNTIAAADSSDNQPSTPSSMDQNGTRPSAYNQELNYYQQAYDQQQQQQHYQPQYPTTGADYPGSTTTATTANSNLMMQPPHEYKTTSRYHPYGSPVHNNAGGHQQQTNTSPSTTNNSNVSPRIVSSTSPNHHSQQQHQNHHLGQPTPSPSPKQCDKCGMVCQTVSELNDHYVTAHSSNGEFGSATNYSSGASFGNTPTAVKDEPACDILDLDSQKMVYPPHHNNNDPSLMNNNGEGPLPSMQSLHTIQRHHPGMWHHAPLGHHDPMYMQQQQQQQQHQQRSAVEYGMMSPVMKSEYGSGTIPPPAQTHLSSSPSSGGVPSIKSEYMGMGSNDMKSFDQSSSSITTSPSDFPTTTTPQDSNNNNTGSQFRNFEPPTSSLPMTSAKSAAWKSNEARRPKTYNCTACNKWFTSSGHLKRHYNTTLHKNAVKASNQPDPATMPISVHHHPARDPNSKHHRNSGQAANNHPPPQTQPPPTQGDPQRSPDAQQFATSGYTNSPNGATGHHHLGGPVPSPLNQGFQQYSALHSSAGIPPNAQAGPSVHASLPRGLLTYSTHHHMEVHQPQEAVLQRHITSSGATTILHLPEPTSPALAAQDPLSLSPTTTTLTHHTSPLQLGIPPINSTTHSMALLGPPPAYISNRLATDTTITSPLSRLEAIHPPLSYHTIIGSGQQQQVQLQSLTRNGSMDSQQSVDMGMDDEVEDEEEPNTDTMIIQSQTHHHHELHQHELHQLAPLAPAVAPSSYQEFAVSSASDTYTIRVLANAHDEDVGDTAPYSPSMPHDPFKQQPMMAMSATAFDHRMTYLQPQSQEQVIMQLPKFAETAPVLLPSPSSPSVSSSETVLHELHQNHQQPQKAAKNQQNNSITTTTTSADPTKKYQCVQCDKTFNKSCYLTQHNKTFHSGEKPFKCHRCGKRFSCPESHEEHVAKHSGDKPFKCELCPKAFNHKTDLRRHMCLHSGRKPFHCDACGKGFIRKDHLVKHMDVHTRKAEQMKRKLEQQPGEGKGQAKKMKLESHYEDEEEDSSMSMMMAM